MIWLLLTLAGHGLTLKTGQTVYCDDFWIEDPMVIIQDAGNRYALRSDLFDWTIPIKAWERPQPDAAETFGSTSIPKAPPLPDFMDYLIDKLEVKQTSVIDVLRLLAHRADFNLVIDAAVPDTAVTFSFRQIRLGDLLVVLLGTLGLSFEYQAQHLWVRPLGWP